MLINIRKEKSSKIIHNQEELLSYFKNRNNSEFKSDDIKNKSFLLKNLKYANSTLYDLYIDDCFYFKSHFDSLITQNNYNAIEDSYCQEYTTNLEYAKVLDYLFSLLEDIDIYYVSSRTPYIVDYSKLTIDDFGKFIKQRPYDLKSRLIELRIIAKSGSDKPKLTIKVFDNDMGTELDLSS